MFYCSLLLPFPETISLDVELVNPLQIPLQFSHVTILGTHYAAFDMKKLMETGKVVPPAGASSSSGNHLTSASVPSSPALTGTGSAETLSLSPSSAPASVNNSPSLSA